LPIDCWDFPVGSASGDVLAAVEGFLDRRYTEDLRLKLLEGSDSGSDLFATAADEGWFDLAVPERFAGSGLHLSDLVGAFRLFGERLLVGPYVEHMVLPALLLNEIDVDPALHDRLARIRDGGARLAWMDVCPSVQWRVGELEATEGKLNGQSRIVRFAPACDELLVVGEAGGEMKLALVRSTTPGVAIDPVESSEPGVPIAAVLLRDIQLGDDDVLASGPEAERVVAKARSWARIMFAAELTGMARRALDLALGYIVQREQFGVPIATFQAVRQMAATATQHVLLLESLADAVAADTAESTLAGLELAAMTFKASAAEFARSVCEDSIQLHGGIGFTYEYVLHWYYKRILALRTWYGDERELSLEVGRARLAR
jgi:alkylation response protein AidB-like acyl-CoA dehydrogenase